MSVQTTFTQDQIKFLLERLFDVMADDFDYNLKPSKRKAILAKAMGARNYDALLQRTTLTSEAEPLDLRDHGFIPSKDDITFRPDLLLRDLRLERLKVLGKSE